MAGTAEGIGVPRFGAYYRYSEAQTQNLAVADGGEHTHTITNATATGANAIDVGYTYSGTVTSGYASCFHAGLAVGGTSSGAFATTQYNAFAADVTVNGTHTAGIGGIYVYMAEGTATLTSAQVYAGYFDIGTDFGTVDYLSCLTLDKHNTTKGTTVDAFINCQLQGSGTGTSLINMQGPAKPTYFLTTHANTGGFIENVQPVAATAAFALDVAIGGTKYRIPILTST